MAQVGLVIDRDSWAVLQDEPLYSARFLHCEGSEEIALVMRVEELDWVLQAHPPFTCSLTTWCSPQGTWVVVVAYQIHPTFGETKGGIFYFNPRQVGDGEILRRLPQQESLCLIFLSEDCSTHYTVKVVQPPQELASWRHQLATVAQALASERLTGEEDPDFAIALQEFLTTSNQ